LPPLFDDIPALKPNRSRKDLLKMIQNQPLPVEIDLQAHCALYPSIFNDVKDLKNEGLVHVMCFNPSSQHKVLLYYLDPKFSAFMRVDDDIKALWHAAVIQREDLVQQPDLDHVGGKRSRAAASLSY